MPRINIAGALGGAFITNTERMGKRCTGAHKLHRGRAFVLALKGGT